MLKASLAFVVVAFFAAFFLDCEITILDPWAELGRMVKGALIPSFKRVFEVWPSVFTTISLALLGTTCGAFFGGILAFFYRYQAVRFLCIAIRSIHVVFWAILLLPFLGLTPLCGIIAITIQFSGIFAKVYSEIEEESDKLPRDGVPKEASRIDRFFYSIYPIISSSVKYYSRYRFECALRSSAVLGFIGIPTIGFYLETMFREGVYSEAAGIMILFYLLVASLKYWVRPAVVVPGIIAAFCFVDLTTLDIINLKSTLTEFVPWPLRNGSDVMGWVSEIWEMASRGITNTVLLTQVALVLTGILTLCVVPFSSKNISSKFVCGITNIFLIILRTTPEYIIAYVFLLLLGPSMLPIIIALTIHNTAIIAFLMAGQSNQIEKSLDAPKRNIDFYGFFVLPQIYGQFLAYLFYRWEVMVRESALLGLLGVYTIGFFIDSAIENDHMDVTLVLILSSGLITMFIDFVSQGVRRYLRISGARTCGELWVG